MMTASFPISVPVHGEYANHSVGHTDSVSAEIHVDFKDVDSPK